MHSRESGKGEYTKEQCEKDQRIVNCTNRDPTDNDDYTCVRMHSESEDGEEYEMRARYIKSVCEEKKKECEDDDRLKEVKLKECTMTCCVSDGDTPCNEGVTFSANTVMMMMMFAVLYILKRF